MSRGREVLELVNSVVQWHYPGSRYFSSFWAAIRGALAFVIRLIPLHGCKFTVNSSKYHSLGNEQGHTTSLLLFCLTRKEPSQKPLQILLLPSLWSGLHLMSILQPTTDRLTIITAGLTWSRFTPLEASCRPEFLGHPTSEQNQFYEQKGRDRTAGWWITNVCYNYSC